ncbi:MAG: hypothetical protein ACHP8B_14355 [Terriglobales bacterium]
MNKLTRACLLVVALLALAGLAAAQSQPRGHFDLDDVHGRYISAEIFLDTSSVHDIAGGVVSGPIYVASAEVLQADGKGNVCGEVDGFYAYPGPGSNTGPSFYHGQYTIGKTDGRVVITTCSDASTVTGMCQDKSACPASAEGNSTRLQVGYIQGDDGNKMVTVSQFESGYPDSTGFVAHTRTWARASDQKGSEDRKDNDRH